MSPEEAPIGLRFAFEIVVRIAPSIEGAPGRLGLRRTVPIVGGMVAGPRLNGRVLPGGADYALIRPDGAAVVTAHYIIEAEDGTPIYIINEGISVTDPVTRARMMAGEPVDLADFYFRTTPRFDAPQGPHQWLSDTIFVASCARSGDKVTIRTFEVL